MTLQFLQIENHTICRSFLGSTSTILDLGGNKGHFIRAMRRTFGCECFTVEPNPALFGNLNSLPEIRALNYAVCGARGEAILNLSPNNEASSLLPRGGAGGVEHDTISVQTIDLAGLVAQIRRSRVDLLKVDIEGAEIAMFDAMPDELAGRFGQISVEFHDFCGVPVADIERIIARFRHLGYRVLKFSRQTYGDVWLLNTRVHEMSRLDFLRARYIHRNLAGARRVLGRTLSGTYG